MKRLIFLFLMLSQFLTAQNYIGFSESNYSGVMSLGFNPANVVDNPYKIDIGIIGAKFQASNNYAYISRPFIDNDIEFKYYDLDGESIKMDGQANFELAAMFSLGKKSGMSVAIRPRAAVFGDGISPELIDEMRLDLSNNIFRLTDENINTRGVSWMEYSVSYGHIIYDESSHFLKGGIDFKLLQGLGAFYTNTNDLSLTYNPNNINDVTDASGDMSIIYSQGLSEDDPNNNRINTFGMGFGAGLIYEWRPDHEKYRYKNAQGETFWKRDMIKYKLKLGVSLVDVGSLNFKPGDFSSSFSITQSEFNSEDIPTNNLEDLHNFIFDPNNQILKANEVPDEFTMRLPAKLNLLVDYNLYKKFYIAGATNISLNKKNSYSGVKEMNTYLLSARYEGRWFGYTLPISYDDIRGVNFGSAFRLGGFFIGSSNITNLIFKNETSSIDIYFGMRISFKHKEKKIKS